MGVESDGDHVQAGGVAGDHEHGVVAPAAHRTVRHHHGSQLAEECQEQKFGGHDNRMG